MGGLAAILAVGTIVESRYDAEMARLLVYDRWWFHLVLALLFANILMAVVVRLPLRRAQLPFASIHLGLLILLSGAFLTEWRGLDGTVEIPEGGASRALRVPETVVRLYRSGHLVSETPVSRGLRPRTGMDLPVGRGTSRIEELLPFSRTVRVAVPDPRGTPVVEAALAMGGAEPVSFRLGLDDPSVPGRIDAGPLEATLERVDDPRAFLDTSSRTPPRLDLRATCGPDTLRLSLADLVRRGRVVRGQNLSIEVLDFFPDADVGVRGIESKSDSLANPAVRLRVRRGDSAWTEILYGKVPAFRFSGTGHPEVSWNVAWQSPNAASESPRLRLGARGDSLYARCEVRGRVVGGFRLEPGRDTTLPLGGLRLAVGKYLARGGVRDSSIAVDPAPGKGLPVPAVRTGNGPWGGPRWIPLGGAIQWSDSSGPAMLSFEVRRLALPFALRLDSFRISNDPGTNQAAAYASSVAVLDTSGGELDSATLSMNRPYKRGGFTFYQASFSREEGRPTVTVLSANRDPGRPWKYAGALLAVLSIAWYVLERSRRGAEAEEG
jgi:hypothetical protein